MYIYGKNVAYDALTGKKKIKKCFLDKDFKENEILSLLKQKKIKIDYVMKKDLDRKVNGLHQGIILEIEDYQYSSLDSILKKENPLLIILDHIEDPHNFGAIIRTCESSGVYGIIIPKDRSVRVNSTVMKTSSGAAVDVKICMVTNLNQTIRYLKDKGYWVVATDMGGENYTNVNYQDSICLVIGNEGNGISSLVKKSSDYVVSIPMIGKINSLNASVASGILIYEVVRQRG